jgi:amino acid efflux transporter
MDPPAVTLRRTIGVGQGVALYVGAILGPGLLVLPAVAAETAGPSSLLAWAALLMLSLPMALTFAALARAYPEAGGFSTYAERAFGRLWGAVVGWLFYFSIPSGSVIVALIAGDYGAGAFGLGRDARYALGGGLVALAYALNLVGLKLSSRVQMLVAIAIVGLLATAIAAAVPRVHSDAMTPFVPHGQYAVGLAAVQLFWAFAGWEAITPLAEEFRDPGREIWRATIIAVGVVAALYGTLAFVTVGTHTYGSSLNGAPPLGAMVSASFGVGARHAAGIVALFVSFGAINAYIAGTSRLGYALGRSGQLPRWFAGLHSTWRTPDKSLAFLATGFALWLAASFAFHLTVADLLPISTSSYIATYVLSMAAGARMLTGWGRVAAVVSLLACLVILGFVGAFFAWIGAVTITCLAFQQLRHRRSPP